MDTNKTTQIAEQSEDSACWSCSAAGASVDHLCARCRELLPSETKDYFTFFGLPHRLTLDLAALEKQFYRLSRKLHPDLYARAGGQEQQWSLEKSSLLNDAYRTLRDPIARTEYLLETEGVHMEEQSGHATETARATGTAKQQVVPADMLEEVFELNMQLEEARMAANGSDAPGLRASLGVAEKDFIAQMEGLDRQLQALWAAWDQALEANDAAAKDDVKQKLVALLNRRSYIRNLVRDVQQALGK